MNMRTHYLMRAAVADKELQKAVRNWCGEVLWQKFDSTEVALQNLLEVVEEEGLRYFADEGTDG